MHSCSQFCSRGPTRQLWDLGLPNQKRPHNQKVTSLCQHKFELKSTTPRDKLVQPVRHIIHFLWWCYEWSLPIFQFYCATFSRSDNFGSGQFPNCKIYNHYWISIRGASVTEYHKSTPDFCKWSRASLTWAIVDETWLDCGALFFLLHYCDTPIDPTLSSRSDTIGTNHIWSKQLTSDDLLFLLIKQVILNRYSPQWDTIWY